MDLRVFRVRNETAGRGRRAKRVNKARDVVCASGSRPRNKQFLASRQGSPGLTFCRTNKAELPKAFMVDRRQKYRSPTSPTRREFLFSFPPRKITPSSLFLRPLVTRDWTRFHPKTGRESCVEADD